MSDRGMKAAGAAHRAGQRTPRGLEQVIVEHMNFGKKHKGLNRTIFFALALAGEAGELCNIIKKKLRGDRKYRGKTGAALFAKQVDGETVDLGNYVYMMAAHREIPLTRRMLEKLLEVEARDDDWNRMPMAHPMCKLRCTDLLNDTRRPRQRKTPRKQTARSRQ